MGLLLLPPPPTHTLTGGGRNQSLIPRASQYFTQNRPPRRRSHSGLGLKEGGDNGLYVARWPNSYIGLLL